MPYRVYQGKEILAAVGSYTPVRGQLVVDLESLDVRVGDGSTINGVQVSSSGGGGGASTGTLYFTDILGELLSSQIPNKAVTPLKLNINNATTASWLLAAADAGGFTWVSPAQSGNVQLLEQRLQSVAFTGDFNDLTHIPQFQTVSTSGNYYDLLNYPQIVSAFRNDAGYISSATLSSYITTATLNQQVDTALSTLIGSSGTAYAVIQQLGDLLSTSTSTVAAFTAAVGNKLDISTATAYTTQQKAIGVANLGLATVAVSGSYNDLADKPATFTVQAATESTIGGVIVGTGLSVDNTGRISANTATVIISQTPPSSLKGQVSQYAGQLLSDQDYIYYCKTNFNPALFQTNQTSSTTTNVISTINSAWALQVDQAKTNYSSGDWHLYNSTKTADYLVTAISTNNGVAYFTIDAPSGITYTTADIFYVQKTDTWARIGLTDSHATSPTSIGGQSPTTVTGTVTLPAGQGYGTTATLMTIDCSDVTYGELAISFTDTANTEYYKGTLEVFVYPDSTFIIHPNIAGNKTDKIVVGYSSGNATPYTNSSQIKIPVYSGDRNVGNNTVNSTSTITTIKYTWLIRSNV